MVIRDIEARNISIPLKRPIKNPAFEFVSSDYTLVNITTDEGIKGWSFAFGMPHTKQVVEELKEILAGESLDIKRLWHKMYRSRVVRFDRGGIAMRALSAIDIALWDILGKSVDRPIYQLLGCYRSEVPVYYSGGHYPVAYTKTSDLTDYLERELKAVLERGFTAVKMKIGRERVPVEIARIAAVREIIGPDCRLMLDAFCAYDPDTVISMAAKFEKYDIGWLEEPVAAEDIPGCAYVASRVSMPVALGESQFTVPQFRDIVEHKAARILQPDITYIGGFTAFVQLAGAAAFHGLKLAPHWCHDLSVQLALSIPEVTALEYTDADSPLFLIHKVIKNPVLASKGVVSAPEGPGHGLILDEQAVSEYLAV